MTPEQLKYSILKYAYSGRLVELGETDSLPKIKNLDFEENPFDIPDSWIWSSLGNCCEMYTGNSISESVKKSKYTGISEGLDYIATKDVTFENAIVYDNGVRIPFGEDFRIAKAGAVLMCIEGGSAGRKIGIIDRDVCFGNKLCMFNSEVIDNKYIYFYLQSNEFKKFFSGNMSGIIGGVSIKKLKELPIPIPPLEEQQQIVARIEELLPFVDRYAASYEKLEQFNAKFPEDMKKSILQYAIQGKLVEQRLEEGTAEELYNQIQEEKQKLIKEGKIKKEKPLAEITEDEIPFDIPDSWKWVRLSEIGELSRGKSRHRPRNDPKLFEGGGIPFIQTGDVAQTDYLIKKWNSEYSDFGLQQSRLWPKGTLCLTIAANIGDVAILDFDACFPDSVVGFNAYSPITDNKYFLYGLMCYKTILDKMSYSTAQKNINIEVLNQVAFPLPPLEEQRRIVAKIEEMLPYCDRLIK